ncbi:MAG: hypothetical protein O3B64_01905 [bacterium]|nr:hypothetical protein [bacterium]MDA1024473.1 hypothetical protein [bacterium]
MTKHVKTPASPWLAGVAFRGEDEVRLLLQEEVEDEFDLSQDSSIATVAEFIDNRPLYCIATSYSTYVYILCQPKRTVKAARLLAGFRVKPGMTICLDKRTAQIA